MTNLDAVMIGKNPFFPAHREQFLIIDTLECFLPDATRVLDNLYTPKSKFVYSFTQ